jgi:signal transduction histidine kinase
MRHVEEQSGLIFEAVQQRKDGTTFPVEVSLRLLEVEGEKLFQEIIRDITERKQSEEVLKESAKNLRHLASQLLRAQEDERKRISLELHDELGHALLALKLQLLSVEDQLLPQQVSLKKEIGKILGVIGTTIEEVRRLYLDLSPGDLEDLGLTTALHSLLDEFADLQKNIIWTIKLDNLDGLLPLSAQTAIYRIVQEALTNIGKHAKPKHVSLEIKREKPGISFTIEDDGIGFERHKIVKEKKTLGLLAMEERVNILGGSFELRSQEDRGTRISFTIPIPGGN